MFISAPTLGLLLLLGLGPAGWYYAWRRDNARMRHAALLRQLLERGGEQPQELPAGLPAEMGALGRELLRLVELYARQSKQHAIALRHYRCQLHIQASLQENLRRRIKSDSPLLRELDDYSLLQEARADFALPAAKHFDLSLVLDEALAEARGILAPGRGVQLSAVLEPGGARQWQGHPEWLRALLKHLLAIALRRTQVGFVRLHLSTEAVRYDSDISMLRIRLSDTGPAMQRWQLRHWLKPDGETEPEPLGEADISWMLAAQLLHRLSGGVNAESSAHGLQLAAWLPLRNTAQYCTLASYTRTLPAEAGPLLFAVERDPEAQAELLERCKRHGCRLFLVPDHSQALQWLSVLPLSAVLLNTGAADSWQTALARIDLLMQQGTVGRLSVGLLADSTPPRSMTLSTGDTLQLLRKPLQTKAFALWCEGLDPHEEPFYQCRDEASLEDISPALLLKMPAIGREFAEQVEIAANLIRLAGEGSNSRALAAQAHAVKSGALSLGYFRLAALMAETEHAALAYSFSALPQNWLVIARCLEQEWGENRFGDSQAQRLI